MAARGWPKEPAARRGRFGAALRSARATAQLTQAALAERLGVRQTTLSAWENAAAVPEPAMVFAVEAGLGLAPGTLSRVLGYLPDGDDQPTPGVVEAVLADPRLRQDAKRALITAYHALLPRDEN